MATIFGRWMLAGVVMVGLLCVATACGSTPATPEGDDDNGPTNNGDTADNTEDAGDTGPIGSDGPTDDGTADAGDDAGGDVAAGGEGDAAAVVEPEPMFAEAAWDEAARRLTLTVPVDAEAVAVAVQFAEAPRSRIDLLPGQARAVGGREAREARPEEAAAALAESVEVTKAAVAQRVHNAYGLARFLHDRLGDHTGTLPATIGLAEAVGDGDSAFSFDTAADAPLLAARLLCAARPELPWEAAHSLCRIGREVLARESLGLAAYRWAWATQAAMLERPGGGTLSAEAAAQRVRSLELRAEPPATANAGEPFGLAGWQLVDAIAFRLGMAIDIASGLRAIGSIASEDVAAREAWRSAWLADRLVEDVPVEDSPRLRVLAMAQAEGPLAAIAAVPELSLGNVRSARDEELVQAGFGELAVQAGAWRFGRLWLTERLLGEGYREALLDRWRIGLPPSLVPMSPLPMWGVIAAAFDDEANDEYLQPAFRLAGRLDAMDLYIAIRVLRRAPTMPAAIARLEDWAATAHGDPRLVPFIRIAAAGAEQEAFAGEAFAAEREVAAARALRLAGLPQE